MDRAGWTEHAGRGGAKDHERGHEPKEEETWVVPASRKHRGLRKHSTGGTEATGSDITWISGPQPPVQRGRLPVLRHRWARRVSVCFSVTPGKAQRKKKQQKKKNPSRPKKSIIGTRKTAQKHQCHHQGAPKGSRAVQARAGLARAGLAY